MPTAPINARPAAPAAAAGALAPLPAPATTPLPPDATYEQVLAAAAANRDQTVAGLGQQRTAGLQEYGFNEQPGGGVQFDPNNPFSRAALLRRHYQESQRGNVTGMAARGQLYSGALQNQQDYTTRGFNEGENSLERAVIAFLAQNTAGVARAGTDYETAASGAAADRVGRAMQSPLYNPEALSNAPEATPAAAKPSVQHEFKRVNGVLYRRVKGSNQQWVKTS